MLGPGSHQCRESALQELSIAPEMKETWKSNPQLNLFEWETLLPASSFNSSIHLNIISSILKEGRRVNGDRWRDLADAGRWDFRHPWYLDGVDELLLAWTYISCVSQSCYSLCNFPRVVYQDGVLPRSLLDRTLCRCRRCTVSGWPPPYYLFLS